MIVSLKNTENHNILPQNKRARENHTLLLFYYVLKYIFSPQNSTLEGVGGGNGYSGELAFTYTQNEYANTDNLPINSLAYTFTSANNIPNVVNGSHILTIGNKNLRIQICFSRSDAAIYVRDNLNGSWKSWKKITAS